MKKGKSKLMRLAACSAAIMMCAGLSGCSLFDVQRNARDKWLHSKMVVIGQAKDVQFWDYVKQGAEDAGKELTYDVEYVSAENTNDIAGQRALIEQAVDNGARAIIIAPNSIDQLDSSLRAAKEKGIVILTIDADISNTELRKGYIGSTNEYAAQLAARQVTEYLKKNPLSNGRHGKVAIITHSTALSSATSRINPFFGGLMEGLGYGKSDSASGNSQGGAPANAGGSQGGAPADAAATTTAPAGEQQGGAPADTGSSQGGAPADAGSTQGGPPAGAGGTQGGPPAGAGGGNPVFIMNPDGKNEDELKAFNCMGDADKAKQLAEKLISENPDLKVLYATNERSTIGVCEAVKAAKAADPQRDIMVFGYNANTTEVQYIQNDILTGTILQNPYNMGYLGVLYAGSELADGSAPGRVDTGVVFVQKKNLNNDEIQLILDPRNYMKNK